MNPPPKHTGMIITTVMMVAILEVLDSTIVNVALPHMMTSLGANSEEITWVLTSYVVAAAMMLPLTGFLTQRMGQKKLLLVDITGFLIASICCGLATSLPEMVLFRLLQGAFGAALIPLSQAILRTSFSLKEQGKAMTIWGIGIMVAPVFGPTLGGYITEHMNWRWIFYINVPVCAVAILLCLLFIEETQQTLRKVDRLGVALMFIGVGSLQMMLDQGNNHAWFSSNYILLLAVLGAYCLSFFIMRCLTHPTPLVNLSLFRDRNFCFSTLILMIYCGCVFGLITLEPLMLQSLFNYTAIISGNALMGFGIGSVFTMVSVPQLMKYVRVKILLTLALLIGASGIYYLSCLNLNATESDFFLVNMIIGGGMGLMIGPLSMYSLINLSKAQITEGAGLFSYGRMLGSSIGISLMGTYLSRQAQLHWHMLGGLITPFSHSLTQWLETQQLKITHPSAITKLSITVSRQSHILAYLTTYRLIALVLFLLIALVLFMQHVDMNREEQANTNAIETVTH